MRAWLAALALGLAVPAGAQQTIERPVAPVGPIRVQLDGIPTSALVTMLLRDIMRVPYVIAPDVLADRRPTSVRLVIPRDRVPERVVAYLRRSGFTVDLQGGTVYVSKSGRYGASAAGPAYAPGVPLGSPVDVGPGTPFAGAAQSSEPISNGSAQSSEAISGEAADPVAPASAEAFAAYVPAHRDPSYLSSVIQPLLPELVFGARAEMKADTTAQRIDGSAGADVLVMAGSAGDVDRAHRLLVMLDRPRPLVAVKAVVMQVQDIQARGSALTVLANLVGGRLGVGSYASDPPASQFVRLSLGGLSAVLSAVREDSRFKVVATPNLAALSGAVASINAGSQVPTLGSVVVTEVGAPVQSVVYRDSGITLTVRPVVRGDLVELDVRQERSTFVRTSTGVEDSPTLQKSTAEAQVILKSGESIVLAGLTEQSNGRTREGLLGGLLGVRSRDQSESELLVVIQAEVVPSPAAAPGQFFDLGEPKPEEDDLAPA